LDELRKEQLKQEHELVQTAKNEFEGSGEAIQEGIAKTGDAVVQTVNTTAETIKKQGTDLQVSLQSLALEIGRIPTAIEGIKFPEFPEFPEIPPAIVKVDIDTEKMNREETQHKVLEQLKGKFVNQ
jgi:hypothetical protein